MPNARQGWRQRCHPWIACQQARGEQPLSTHNSASTADHHPNLELLSDRGLLTAAVEDISFIVSTAANSSLRIHVLQPPPVRQGLSDDSEPTQPSSSLTQEQHRFVEHRIDHSTGARLAGIPHWYTNASFLTVVHIAPRFVVFLRTCDL